MENLSKHIAVIDIGTTKIVAIIGTKNNDGRFEILGFGKAPSMGVKRGVVVNIEETAKAIKQAVTQAEEMSGITFTKVYVGVAGQHIKSSMNRAYKFIPNPDEAIKQEDVDQLLNEMYQTPLELGQEIVHVIPQSYIIDNEAGITKPVGVFGRRLEGNYHIVIGETASTRNIKTCIANLGLEVIEMILEPLASAAAVLTADEKEAGVALIDIGGGTTDLAIYYDGIIRHTQVIPFGGDAVTSDIKQGCSILLRHAELLKVEHGSALADLAEENVVVSIPGINGREPKEISYQTLANIIQARMEEIIDQIAFAIENSGYIERLGAGIALTGGGAMLRHLSELMKFQTGLDVRVAMPTKYQVVSQKTNITSPMYSTSVGLLKMGHQHQQERLQKLAEIERKRAQEQQNIEQTQEEELPQKESSANRGIFDGIRKSIDEFFKEKDKEI